MGHSTDGATAAPAPCPAPAQVAKPAPEAPAEQMDHDSMPGMDMEPKAPSCSPEHAAMRHCTPAAGAPDKKEPHLAPTDHDMAPPADPHCPPAHTHIGPSTPNDLPTGRIAGRDEQKRRDLQP